MDAVLCLQKATDFQSMELERPEAICGFDSGTHSRLWCTRGDCADRQEGALLTAFARSSTPAGRKALGAVLDHLWLGFPSFPRIGSGNCCLGERS